MTAQPYRIDTHHHIIPQEYVQAVAKFGALDAGGIAFPRTTPQEAIGFMDRQGIAAAVSSISAPGVYFGDRKAARELARRCNEWQARLVSDHPTRFGAFAVLPLPSVDDSLEEIAYAFDTLQLDGVMLLGSIGEQYLGDAAFDPVFDELNRRKSVVFIHPNVPATSRALKLALPGAVVEFVFDTTRAVANLIYSGTLERCPDLSIILSHAGGTVPFLASRIALGVFDPTLRERAPKGALAYLKRLYYDTALSANPYALQSLRELVEPSQILFGSDTPFAPERLIESGIQELGRFARFSPADRRAIERDNALRLFPRLRSALEIPQVVARVAGAR